MNVRLATDQDQQQWNTFVFASPQGSFLQSWEWGQMHTLLGHQIWRLVIEDNGTWLAAALILKRELPLNRCWLYAPHGPVMKEATNAGAFAAFQEKFKEIAKEERALFIRIDPLWTNVALPSDAFQFKKAEREVQPQHTLLLDITKPEEELLAGMHSKTRYNIRLAEKKGVTVRFSASLNDIETFLELSHDVESRSNFHFHPDNYYRAMLSSLAPANMLEIALAEYKEKPLAAHIMVYAGGVATYTHGASSSSHRALMGPTLVYWKTIQRAKEKGIQTYDFFGVAPSGSDQNHPWAGLTRIKEGFGGARVGYIGAHDLVLDESFYTLVNTIRRVKQLWR